MKSLFWTCAALLAGIAVCGGAGNVAAYELEPGVNTAGVIEYPTALDQFLPHTVHSTIEIFDLGKPDLALENLRYGFQVGALQLLGDIFLLTDPDRKFDHAVLRAKLRVLHFDPQRTSIAVGALARLTDSRAGEERTENKPLSLLGIVTTELFPFREWGGFLINGYIDNRVAVAGLKVQIYRFIQAVAEFDFFHSSDIDDREQTKAGIEIEGETDFYFQIFWAERSERALVQVGVGF